MRLIYTVGAKATAIILFAVLTFFMLASAAGVMMNYALGFYNFDAGDDFAYALEKQGFSADSQYADLARVLYTYRTDFIWQTVSLVLVVLGDFIYILSVSGHKNEYDGVYLSFFDRIPLDINAVIVALTGYFTLRGGYNAFRSLWQSFEYYGYSSRAEMSALAAAVLGSLTLAALLALWLASTLAVRIKAGTVLRDTVLYWLASLLRRGTAALGAFFVSIPLVWRTASVTAALAVFALFVVGTFLGGIPLIIFTVADAALFTVIVAGALQLAKLQNAARRLAGGDLSYKTETRGMVLDFKEHAENLNSIGDGMLRAVEERTRSERLKAELITNVSHDIKTPLTSIVNYVDLLQRASTEEERKQYLEVLARQSAKLKKLTEDLVEASKASTGNLRVEREPTDADEIINQALAEYSVRLADAGLTVVYTKPGKPVTLLADGRHLWRVLDNLLSNAAKYALTGTRVYVETAVNGDRATISVKNVSRERLNISAEELTERFVRGDASRSTQGSGLGLNIAKSLTELMGGRFRLTVDGDLFKAEVIMPLCDDTLEDWAGEIKNQ